MGFPFSTHLSNEVRARVQRDNDNALSLFSEIPFRVMFQTKVLFGFGTTKENLTFLSNMSDIEEGPRVLGIGFGLFALILLWSLTLIAILVFNRLSPGTAIALAALSTVITAVLLAVPRHPSPAALERAKLENSLLRNVEEDGNGDDAEREQFKIYDMSSIVKILISLTMSAFAVAGAIIFVCSHCTQGVYHQPMKKLKIH